MTSQVEQLFECAYCGAIIRARIIPEKCQTCGHEAFLMLTVNVSDKTEDKKYDENMVEDV